MDYCIGYLHNFSGILIEQVLLEIELPISLNFPPFPMFMSTPKLLANWLEFKEVFVLLVSTNIPFKLLDIRLSFIILSWEPNKEIEEISLESNTFFEITESPIV